MLTEKEIALWQDVERAALKLAAGITDEQKDLLSDGVLGGFKKLIVEIKKDAKN